VAEAGALKVLKSRLSFEVRRHWSVTQRFRLGYVSLELYCVGTALSYYVDSAFGVTETAVMS
jgi:hypothetical protein